MSSTEPKPRRPRRLSNLNFLMIALATVVASAFLLGVVAGLTGRDFRQLLPFVALLGLLIGGGLSIAAWRQLDEAQQEAHKWSWYWGSGIGAAAAFPLFLLGDQSQDLIARLGLDNTFENGVVCVLGLQLLGWLLAWAFWWLRRR